jgi:uncharacterized hydrophobic protein (TIGR00271 family)
MVASSQADLLTNLGFDSAYLGTFEDKLFIEGPQKARRLLNFFVLLLLATVIATYGVLSNSSATVIGAMVVAPLMGPILATTAAVVMGSLPRALRAFALSVAGTVLVILFSYLLSSIVPDVAISFTSNAEITSRIQPGLYALLTALGSGAAGAFITSRAEISDALSGVAIAISLVPPLCVVGIALQQAQMDAAAGAFLLFLTNSVAILTGGGLVFLLLGVGKSAITRETRRFRRRSIVVFLVGLLLVIIPLTLTAYQQVVRAAAHANATSVVQAWRAGTPYQVDTVDLNDGVVAVTIGGSGQLPPPQQLANRLSSALGRPVTVKLSVIPGQTIRSGSP